MNSVMSITELLSTITEKIFFILTLFLVKNNRENNQPG